MNETENRVGDCDYKSLFGSRYATALDLEGKQATLTISHLTREELANPETGDVAEKVIVYFQGAKKGMVLNRTNATCIAGMFGPRTGAWPGKRVTLHATPVQVGPKRELGIRVLGSPDISEPIQVVVVLPRRKPITMTMIPTGRQQGREPGEEG